MSNYNVDTLENKIVVEAQEAIKSLQSIIGYVNQSKTAIDSMKSATGLKSLDNQAKKTTSNLTKLQLVSKNLKSALNFTGLIYGVKRAYGFLKSSAEASIDYIETLNLFEVSMGKTLTQYGNLDSASSKYYTRALKFQRELNERFGTNIEETMRYQALYNQMSESMGINDDASYTISENLTKLGIDLASLFNKSEKDTMEALRAGVLAGQTKPLRNYGLDVTQQTLAPLASELGIDRSVKQLSQAEKMILRYIAVLRQASSAHGDFAKTIESPANQLKVFKQQFTELKTAIGNLFQGMLGYILPVANAILMVIKELIKAVANLFGFKVSSSSTNLADQTGIEDLESGLGEAVGSAKELKAQLMGFDEINNITTDTGSGGASGGVSSTGIDSKLLDAMKDYDNLMGKVKMKATKIRDNIMEWLGFTKEINPLTGEINWELDEGLTNFEKILDAVKMIGISLGTWKVTKTITKLLENLGVLSGAQSFKIAFGLTLALTGIYATYKGATHLIDGDIDLFTLLETIGGAGAGTMGIFSLLRMTSLGQTLGIGKSLTISLGITLAITGFTLLLDGINKDDVQQQIWGALGITGSGAMIGMTVGGPVGAAIGAATGLIASGITALIGYNSQLDETQQKLKEQREEWEKIGEESKALTDDWEQTVATAQARIDSNDAELESVRRLTNELEGLVDSNGRVKDGYEDRVQYILGNLNSALGTEYELTGNQITQNGKLYDSYSKIEDEIYKVIEAKRAQVQYEANEKVYKKALDNAQNYYDAMVNTKKANEEAYDAMVGFYNYYMGNFSNYTDGERMRVSQMAESMRKFNVTLDDVINNTDNWKNAMRDAGDSIIGPQLTKLTDEANKHRDAINNTSTAYEQAKETANTAIDTVVTHEKLGTALLKGNQEEVNKILEEIQSMNGETEASWVNRVGRVLYESNREKDILKRNGEEITEEEQAQLDARIRAVADNLAQTTSTVTELSEDQKEAWKLLATGSYKVYEEVLNNLEPTLRTDLQNMTGVIVEKTPEVERVTAELGEKMLEQLDNNSEMRKQAVENVKAYLQGLSEEKQRSLLKQAGIENADQVIAGLKQGNLAEDVGINIIKGLRTGLQNNYWQGQTLNTAFNFASNILSKFKRTFGIASPSKKTKQFGLYLLEGLGLGIENGQKDVLNKVSNFSKEVLGEFSAPLDFIKNGVSVDQNKLAVDASQFVDYGAIEGNINSNLNLNSNLSQIPNLVYNAVMQGMKNSNIQVDIKAETEEGVIVKKASQGFKDYVTQTGELPFPIPV